uniref:CHK domain-containing protein n=1 Tax=Rhabditophanes sp. KR3021 TaxID=114890 RepID=A0AC35U3C2_9BILA
MNELFADNEYLGRDFHGTHTSIEWVVKCVHNKSPEFDKVRDGSKISKITFFDVSGGKGFVSNVYKVTLTFVNNNTYPFVLKIPKVVDIGKAIGGMTEEQCKKMSDALNDEIVARLHKRELDFYLNFGSIPDLKVPRFFGGQEWIVDKKREGCIVMEYLGDDAINLDFSKSFNRKQLDHVLDQLLILHTHSLCLPEADWKNKYKYAFDPKTLNFFEDQFKPNWELLKTFIPEDKWKPIEKEVLSMGERNVDIITHVHITLPARQNNHSVLSHADLWTNNILFSKSTGDLISLIDWQTVYEGNITVDLARLFVMGHSYEVRHKLEAEVLPEYFESLKKNVLQKGGKFTMAFEEFMELYYYSLIEQALAMTMGMSLLLFHNHHPDPAVFEQKKAKFILNIYHANVDAVAAVKKIKKEWLVHKK